MSSLPAAGSAPSVSSPSRLRSILFPALPLARIRVLRVLLYAFVMLDVLTLSRDVLAHAHNAGFYTPLALARLLQLPAVTTPLASTDGAATITSPTGVAWSMRALSALRSPRCSPRRGCPPS